MMEMVGSRLQSSQMSAASTSAEGLDQQVCSRPAQVQNGRILAAGCLVEDRGCGLWISRLSNECGRLPG